MDKSKFVERNKAAETPKHWVRLTYLCNNNCVFCLDKQNQKGKLVPFKEIEKELKGGRKSGINKLILSGGEPTVHPDFLKIVKFAKDIGYKEIQTITNGRLFAYKNFLDQAVANGLTETTFSIHGHTKELYEKQSGIKNSFEQALTGLTNSLNNKNLIVNIDIVINKINYRYLDKILRFFTNLGVKEFDLLQIIPFGAAWQNKNKVFYNLKKAAPYFKKAFSLQNKYPNIYIWTNRLPAQYLEGFEELIQHPIKLFDEIRGREKILKNFIKKNKLMNCYGAQCKYCFLNNFCSDLIKIKKIGQLISKTYPPCIKIDKSSIEKFLWKDFNLNKFLNFFIDHRYFVKSLRCDNCRYNKNCSGMQINYIRKNSFKKLTPLK
jgi:MoaA/NifB/PqqE/SkfB family radical SAM enzyme